MPSAANKVQPLTIAILVQFRFPFLSTHSLPCVCALAHRCLFPSRFRPSTLDLNGAPHAPAPSAQPARPQRRTVSSVTGRGAVRVGRPLADRPLVRTFAPLLLPALSPATSRPVRLVRFPCIPRLPTQRAGPLAFSTQASCACLSLSSPNCFGALALTCSDPRQLLRACESPALRLPTQHPP